MISDCIFNSISPQITNMLRLRNKKTNFPWALLPIGLIWGSLLSILWTQITVKLNLTHLSRMEFLTDINWTSPFPFEGFLGGIFHFYSNFHRTFCKQTVETLIRCHILWHLIWVSTVYQHPTKRTPVLYGLRPCQIKFKTIDLTVYLPIHIFWNEPVHEISNKMVCATSKASDQHAHTCSLIRALASRLGILWLLSYWLNTIWSF